MAEGRLEGRVALVTGSTSGIGLGVADALARAGCHVVINGFGEPAEIERIRADLARRGGEVIHGDADMRRPEQIAAMVRDAQAHFGSLDIVVNNAGIQHVAPVHEFPTDKWNDIIAINLSSSFHTISAALPGMLTSGWGRIVNIASAHALVASPFKSAYVAAKHGVAGLTKTVALEVAEQGITVNAIAPGYVRTPLVENQIADTARARGITEEAVVRDVMLAAQPTKQFVSIEQVADLAVYLCTEAAAGITGSILSIDGGWSAR
ncbi:MAG: 3-hydroxybutyrate dehydrogenase [Pseudomonadota bacterium]